MNWQGDILRPSRGTTMNILYHSHGTTMIDNPQDVLIAAFIIASLFVLLFAAIRIVDKSRQDIEG